VRAKDDIVALWATPPLRLADVRTRAFRKLGVSARALQYKDEEGDLVTVVADTDLALAMAGRPRTLVLYVAST
jgi:hypothetical protein